MKYKVGKSVRIRTAVVSNADIERRKFRRYLLFIAIGKQLFPGFFLRQNPAKYIVDKSINEPI
jgi:hypothetical protein